MSGDCIDIVSQIFRCDGEAGPNMSEFLVVKQRHTQNAPVKSGQACTRHDKYLD